MNLLWTGLKVIFHLLEHITLTTSLYPGAAMANRDSKDIPEDRDPLQLQTNHPHELEEGSTQLKQKNNKKNHLKEMKH